MSLLIDGVLGCVEIRVGQREKLTKFELTNNWLAVEDLTYLLMFEIGDILLIFDIS